MKVLNRLREMKEFSDLDNWFEIHKIDNYVYIIRERLDLIEPRYLTRYINNYLLVGNHTAALIDTGTGIHRISSAIKELVADRELLVFNTHNHFDHVLSNHEFPEVYIHKMDYKEIADRFFNKVDIANSGQETVEMYATQKYDIVFTDLNMNEKNGIEIKRKIKKIDNKQKFMIISTNTESHKILVIF